MGSIILYTRKKKTKHFEHDCRLFANSKLVVFWTHLTNMLVKSDHFPNIRGENKNIWVATTKQLLESKKTPTDQTWEHTKKNMEPTCLCFGNPES